jgi:hypothetical protein
VYIGVLLFILTCLIANKLVVDHVSIEFVSMHGISSNLTVLGLVLRDYDGVELLRGWFWFAG